MKYPYNTIVLRCSHQPHRIDVVNNGALVIRNHTRYEKLYWLNALNGGPYSQVPINVKLWMSLLGNSEFMPSCFIFLAAIRIRLATGMWSAEYDGSHIVTSGTLTDFLYSAHDKHDHRASKKLSKTTRTNSLPTRRLDETKRTNSLPTRRLDETKRTNSLPQLSGATT